MKIFAYDGAVSKFLERIFDLMLLHILWVVFSLPLITIGASTTALFTVTMRMVRKEEGYVLKSFLRAFRDNFMKSTVIWLCFVSAFGWCVGMILISMHSGSQALKLLSLAQAALVVLLVLALQYVFPIQARYENTVAQTIKNAFILSLKFLPYSIGMLAAVAAPVLATAYLGRAYALLLFLWMFFGSSLIALGDSYLVTMVFDRAE